MATRVHLPNSADNMTHSGARVPNRLAAWVRRVPPSWWKYGLIVSDGLLILLALLLAYWIRYRLQWFRAVDPVYQATLSTYTPFATALVCVLLLSFHLSGVYRTRRDRGYLEELYAIITATTTGVVILMAASLIRPLAYSRLIFLYTAVLVTLLLGASRIFIGLARRYLRYQGVGVDRVLLIGAGDIGRMVMRNMAARPELGYRLIGFLDDNPVKGNTDIGRFKALGSVANFGAVVSKYQLDQAIICLPWQSHRTVVRLVNECERRNIRALVVPDLFQLTKDQVKMEELNGIPLISARSVTITGWNLLLKRGFDLLLGSLLLLFSLPFWLVIAAAIRIDSPGPALYTQTRIGKNHRPFAVYKFRSMSIDADKRRGDIASLNVATGPLFKVRDDPRRTRVGRFLRRYSLDELPQLLNVLKGEMSLAGPRPNLPEEVAAYLDWHEKRLSVSPGMTGLWQVSGRSDLTFDEMVLLDIYYAENWSLALDLNILLRTIPTVLFSRGAY